MGARKSFEKPSPYIKFGEVQKGFEYEGKVIDVKTTDYKGKILKTLVFEDGKQMTPPKAVADAIGNAYGTSKAGEVTNDRGETYTTTIYEGWEEKVVGKTLFFIYHGKSGNAFNIDVGEVE